MVRLFRFGVLALVLSAVAPAAFADSVTFSATNGTNLSASVTFTTGPGGTLTVQLTNSGTDVLAPADVLTGVFFNLAGVTLTPSSAMLASGSTIIFGGGANCSATPVSLCAGPNVGGEWAYVSGLSGAPGGATSGISSSGLGLFGGGNFNGVNLQDPAALDGVQYGIVSGVDNPATGNAKVTGSQALIQNSVIFTLTGLPAGYTLAGNVSNVSFQYGTALTEPCIGACTPVPEPGTLALFGTGLVGLAGLVRRRYIA